MIVNYTDTTVTISWMPPHSPNGEIIQYRILFDSDGSFTTVNTTADDLSYKATGLMPGNRYRFSVTAVTVVGEGNPSNIVDVSVGKLNVKQKACCCFKKAWPSKVESKVLSGTWDGW